MKKLTGYWVIISYNDDKKDLPAIIFTDTEENAVNQVKNMFKSVKSIKLLDENISWYQFKSLFDTTNWPESLKEVDDGYFPDDIFSKVCDFCMEGYNVVLRNQKNWTSIKIETHNN